MKKTISKLVLALILAPLLVATAANAATSGDVLTLSASQDENGLITFSGTTDFNVLAVSCSLLDSSDTEILFGSVAVDNATFGGEFTAEVADYTLKCANYDGGTWLSAVIEAPAAKTDSPDTGYATSQNTSDASLSGSAIAAVSIVAVLIVAGIMGIIFKYQKSHKAE